jgi:energy-coupling factor transporter ATP-binding protein EcfA2
VTKTSLSDLYFGKASAEADVSEDEDRFWRTYYDRWNLHRKLSEKSFFLVVGPKGSGKSAVAEYVRLSLERQHGRELVFYRNLNIDEASPIVAPITDLRSRMVFEQASTVTDAAWRLFLGLRLLDLLIEDPKASLSRDGRAQSFIRRLQTTGLLSSDYPSVLRTIRQNKLTFSIKGLLGGEKSSQPTNEIAVNQVSDAIMRLIVSSESASHYLLAIDGLDRIISDDDVYWKNLVSLLRVGDDFHAKLRGAQSDVRLLVMCRSDVLRKLHFGDLDKISGNATQYVDWGAQQTRPQDSHLWDYLALKAGISPEALFNLLPPHVTVGERASGPRKIPIARYLLQFTRSTPRELTVLMQRLQDEVPAGWAVTERHVRDAADFFASHDLLAVVQAEATGILERTVHDSLDSILSALPFATGLQLADIESALTICKLDPSLAPKLAEFLFFAGLIGTYNPATGYVNFYHRRDTAQFRINAQWTLHLGIMYAFNIPYSNPAYH